MGTATFKHLSLQIKKSIKLQIVSHLRISVNWPRGYKTFFSCSTELITKFQQLIKTKMLKSEEVSCCKSIRC